MTDRPAKAVTVTLGCDAAPFEAALARVEALLAHAPDRLGEAVDALFGVGDAAPEIVRFEVDPHPAGAGEVVVRLQPGDGLCRFLTASGAGNAD